MTINNVYMQTSTCYVLSAPPVWCNRTSPHTYVYVFAEMIANHNCTELFRLAAIFRKS